MFGELSRTLDPLFTLHQALEQATARRDFVALSFRKDEHAYVLTAELPGVRKEEIELEVRNDFLRLTGERRPSYDETKVTAHRRERSFGRFDRTLKLPYGVDATAVTADYKDGVLTVRLPLAEAAKPKKIAIA